MVRKSKTRRDPNALINVQIHPELHKMISHQAIDEDQTIRERLHIILCEELGRSDLLLQTVEQTTAASA